MSNYETDYGLVPSLKIAIERNKFADKLIHVIMAIFFTGVAAFFWHLYGESNPAAYVGYFAWLVSIAMTVYLFVYNLYTSKLLDKARVEIKEMRT